MIRFIFKSDAKLNIDYDWNLVAEKKECDGSEINFNYKTTMATEDIAMCAHICREKSSMFALGTNDFGNDRCNVDGYKHGCSCLCETGAKPDGTCDIVGATGYRLYKYKKGKMKSQ